MLSPIPSSLLDLWCIKTPFFPTSVRIKAWGILMCPVRMDGHKGQSYGSLSLEGPTILHGKNYLILVNIMRLSLDPLTVVW